MSERRLVPLSEVADVSGGYAFKSKDYVPNGHFVLRTLNISDQGRIDKNNAVFLPEEDVPKYPKFSLREFDTVFVMVGATLGKTGLVTCTDLPALLNQNMWRIRAKTNKCDPRFLHYCFLVNKNKIEGFASGSARSFLRRDDCREMLVEIPHVEDQKAIARILGTLDDKIELNQKMNQTLEDIAKAIFKSWFVDFDPVRAKAEGRPTGLSPEISDLFPDESVDSEIGEIPKGWDVGTLSDVADITMGQSPPGDTYNDDGVGLPFYQGSTDFGFRFPSLRKYCSEPKRLADADDVLISVRAPVGDLNRAKDDCCIGRGLASVRAKNSLQSWVFYRCKFLSQQLEMFNSEGTVFGSINGKDLKGLPTILAPEFLCKAFDEIGKPMDDAVRNRSLEIEVLTELRDILLPKLISGELRIPDAEKFLEAVGI
ncbi:restriction endonuclease subunit S [bacterium]|nr:restriction endonuclease subunit S [bacterium]